MRAEHRGVTTHLSALREQLRNVYWLGGGSGAGKSTVARQLAREHSLVLYATDDRMPEHAARTTESGAPFLHQFMAMSMDERWVDRSPANMLETFHWFRGEAFELIVEDLLRLPPDVPVIAEGFRLLPRLVKPLLSDSNHAVWLLPTPEFRQATLQRRGGSKSGFFARTSNPETALQNLLGRDRMFTDRLREELVQLDLPAVEITPGMQEADSVRLVAGIFGL